MSFPGSTYLARTCHNAHLWLPGYVQQRLSRPVFERPTSAWLLFADHFEPGVGDADRFTMLERVRRWRQRWPEIAYRQTDSTGRPARYTFFYPEEQYDPEILDSLASMAQAGVADVEVHLHHDGEGEQDFVDRISCFTRRLHDCHGLLHEWNGRLSFGFIHGNWSLANSLPGGRLCGLNHEIALLRGLGCYADFTLPSAPSAAQTPMVNTIYWADDQPGRPRSHDAGRPVRAGESVGGDLMLVPGPLGFNFRGGRLLPRVENGELAAHYPVTVQRVKRWLDLAPRIGANIFIKLFAHGAPEDNAATLLGRDLDFALSTLRQECASRELALYFVSAWEMRQAIEAVRMNLDPVGAIACKLVDQLEH